MGALHEGHLSLVRIGRRHAARVLVTIFVNPTQFGPAEDLSRYPRDLAKDLDKCRDEGVDAVFAPASEEMYPAGEATRVRVSVLTEHLCGATRPDHFEGVATIVTKLLAAAGPCFAVFGKKDYQQLRVIQRLVQDLLLPVQVKAGPLVRESDGLALSSRNVFLTLAEREQALGLVQALSRATRAHHAGERRVAALVEEAARGLDPSGLRLDYLMLVDTERLQPLVSDGRLQAPALLAVAAFVGKTRLIDNVVLGEDPDPLAPERLRVRSARILGSP
jgi:pantoate--beta-alanine ligase